MEGGTSHVELKEFIAVSNQVENESDVSYQAPRTWGVFPGGLLLSNIPVFSGKTKAHLPFFFTNLILLEAWKNHGGHPWPRSCREMGCGQIILVLWSCQWNLPVCQLSSHPIPPSLTLLFCAGCSMACHPPPQKKKSRKYVYQECFVIEITFLGGATSR